MSHDYDPSWDYDIDRRPSPEVKRLVGRFISGEEHQKVLKALNIPLPTLYYVKNLGGGGHLGKYVNGTSSDPVILLDAKFLMKESKGYGVSLSDAVESTLLHEYAHVYFDATGAHEEMEEQEEEERAEKFAHTYWETRDLSLAMKVLER